MHPQGRNTVKRIDDPSFLKAQRREEPVKAGKKLGDRCWIGFKRV